MSDFLKGIFYLLQAFTHLFTRGLKRFIVLPIIFNITLFGIISYLIYHSSWVNSHSWIWQAIILLGFFILFFSMFTILFTIVAAPFNGLLAEKAQNLLCRRSISTISFGHMVVQSFKRQGQFLAYLLPRLLVMVLIFFLPVVHFFYPFLWFLFGSWILSMQFIDVVCDNNGKTFQEMRRSMRQRPMLFLGYGFMLSAVSFIPLINLILMPTAVIGAVLMYNQEYHANSQ